MRVVPLSALALVTAAAVLVSPLSAQRREFSIFAGPNLTGVSGGRVAHSTSRTGFLAGVSLRIPRSDRFSFQTELLVIQNRVKGERTAAPSGTPPIQVGPASDDADLLYAQLPLLGRFQRGFSTDPGFRPFIVLGPYFGLRMGCRRELLQGDGTIRRTDCEVPNGPVSGPDAYYAAVFQELDVGLLAEVGVERQRFSVKVRGSKSVRNLVDPGAVPTSPFEKARLWYASFSLAYVLKVI
jgi:hypothetical protein